MRKPKSWPKDMPDTPPVNNQPVRNGIDTGNPATQQTSSDLSAAKRILLERRISLLGSGKPGVDRILRRPDAPSVCLSSAQQRLWFLSELAPGNSFYNIPSAVRVSGRLKSAALEQSLQETVRRHEALRTCIRPEHNRPVQVVLEGVGARVEMTDLRALSAPDREATTRRLTREETERPFDLSNGPLLRARLLWLAESDYVLVLTLHHIISDAWSHTLLIGELSQFYRKFERGEQSRLAELEIQYADYSVWQRHWLNGAACKQQLDYWRAQLEDSETLHLPTDRPRPQIQSFRGATEHMQVGAELLIKLRTLALQTDATLYMVLLAGFVTLLQRYSGAAEVMIGTPIANRNRSETEGLVGFFVNTLAIRVRLEEAQTCLELVKAVKEVCLGAYEHQDLPFDALVEDLQPERDMSRHPLFQVGFSLQSSYEGMMHCLGDTQLRAVELDNQTSKYDWTLQVIEGQRSLQLYLEYSTDLFDGDTIRRALRHYLNLLCSAVADSGERIGQLEMLTEYERRQLSADWNSTEVIYDREILVPELIEIQAQTVPDTVALVCGDEFTTFETLNARANQLAQFLRRRGVQEESLVGVVATRSSETIVSILSVLKAGGAYIALDSDLPGNRLQFVHQNCGGGLVLTQDKSSLLGVVPENQILGLSEMWDVISRESEECPRTQIGPDNLAYLVYTSGSTGEPKAVLLQHRGLANFVRSQVGEIGIGKGSRVLQFASLTFDASITEIFPALVSGGMVCLAAHEQLLGGVEMERLIQQTHINLAILPPSVLRLLSPEAIPDLETVVAAGESCSQTIVRDWSKGRHLYNAYGPTEATVGPLLFKTEQKDAGRTNIPIGRPVANTHAYLINLSCELNATGIPGEIVIGGVGVARGYLNRPAITAERFIPDPFNDKPGARLYRTGDLGKRLRDGNIAYVARIDQQVKIRGYRIEPGEIESALKQHPSVDDACVVATELDSSRAKLTGFVALKDSHKLELWPSVAEYFVYDDLLYQAMTADERRNQSYKTAISQVVKDGVVLDVGTGRDAILARICAEAGAKRIYAVEAQETAFKQATDLIRALGLEGRIIPIHSDVNDFAPPESIDVCVSEIVGPIGGSEGAAVLMNRIRDKMKGGTFIPSRSVTNIAAVTLPDDFAANPGFSDLTADYVRRIFTQVGREFDLRLCIKGLDYSCLISDIGIFEDLDFQSYISPESEHCISVEVTRDARLDGFLVWLSLETIRGEVIDTLEHEHCWLPVFMPIVYPGIKVLKGDSIRGVIKRTLSDNGINPDYRVAGQISGEHTQVTLFAFESRHHKASEGANPFYRRLFSERGLRMRATPPTPFELKRFLGDKLPSYMVPSAIARVDRLPLTRNKKIDRRRLATLAKEGSGAGARHVPPTTHQEITVANAWKETLRTSSVGVDESFFEAGGHSLLLAELSKRLTEALNREVTILELYRFPTISSFISHLNSDEDPETGRSSRGESRHQKRQTKQSIAQARLNKRRRDSANAAPEIS